VTPNKTDFSHRIFRYGKDSTIIGDTLLLNNALGGDPSEGLPVIDGIQLTFSGNTPLLRVNRDSSGWNRATIYQYNTQPYHNTVASGIGYIDSMTRGDYRIVFSDGNVDTSKQFSRKISTRANAVLSVIPATPVNFSIFDIKTGIKIPFAFLDADSIGTAHYHKFSFDTLGAGHLSDQIIFLSPHPVSQDNPDGWVAGLVVTLTQNGSAATANSFPGIGDVLTLKFNKPFLANDTYTFTVTSPTINTDIAKGSIDNIRVVPNPYIVTNSWEPANQYIVGSRERVLHFTHLPSKCTIKIFNVRGQLVNTLYHDNPMNDGTEVWNMLSKDNLEIAYGIYIYNVDAGNIGQKIGKFAVIK